MDDNDITKIVGWPTEPEMVKYRKVVAAAIAAEREMWRTAALAGCDGTHPKYAEALRNLVAMMDEELGPNVEVRGGRLLARPS